MPGTDPMTPAEKAVNARRDEAELAALKRLQECLTAEERAHIAKLTDRQLWDLVKLLRKVANDLQQAGLLKQAAANREFGRLLDDAGFFGLPR